MKYLITEMEVDYRIRNSFDVRRKRCYYFVIQGRYHSTPLWIYRKSVGRKLLETFFIFYIDGITRRGSNTFVTFGFARFRKPGIPTSYFTKKRSYNVYFTKSDVPRMVMTVTLTFSH